jgi:hypothetical protein
MEKKQAAPWQTAWQIIGLAVFIAASAFRNEQFIILGTMLMLSHFLYSMVMDWRRGDRKAFRKRVAWLALALAAGIAAYIYCARQ